MTRNSRLDGLDYELCKHCDHFVHANDDPTPGVARFLHLEDGAQEFDHAPAPSGRVHTLRAWKKVRPDLFIRYPDGRIGPNSSHHSRRGKIDCSKRASGAS